MLEQLIGQNAADVEWLLLNRKLTPGRRQAFLYSNLSSASRSELKSILSSTALLKRVFEVLDGAEPLHVELLSSILNEVELPAPDEYKFILTLIPLLNKSETLNWLLKTIYLSLNLNATTVSAKKLASYLNEAGSALSGFRFFATGLNQRISSKNVERNIEAIRHCKGDARKRLCSSVDELAEQLANRLPIDLSIDASETLADLLWESNKKSYIALEKASIRLLPYLLKQPSISASPLISATFPIIYLELAQDTPSSFISMIFRFGDWDKCRTARQGLVEAFMKSNWRITDFATAAARSADAKKILELLTYEPGGYKILERLHNDLDLVPGSSRSSIKYALDEILNEN